MYLNDISVFFIKVESSYLHKSALSQFQANTVLINIFQIPFNF